jgi:hypothetical protein
VTYYGALLTEKAKHPKRILSASVLLTLFPLAFFKYSTFINDNISNALSGVGLNFHLQGLNWAIPIGISFFTFQALGYLWDVYYKRQKAERDFLTYALFVSFFPSILSGPINKASLIIPQLKSIRPYFEYSTAVEGLKMLLWGMFMKVVVADRVGLYVDTVLPDYMNYTGVTCFAASIFYTVQIYADFAGYSLMAIGSGGFFEDSTYFRSNDGMIIGSSFVSAVSIVKGEVLFVFSDEVSTVYGNSIIPVLETGTFLGVVEGLQGVSSINATSWINSATVNLHLLWFEIIGILQDWIIDCTVS